jgi:hypothetical protein
MQYACGEGEGNTDAPAHYNETIALAMECEDAFTASN